MSARISSVRRVSSHIFTKNFENIERETFFSVDSCRQFPPSYVSCFPRVLRPWSLFLFPPSLSFSFFSSSCPFARKPRLRDLHRLYQFRFPLFKVARYLVPDPPTLSPLYLSRAITVRSPTWRRPFLYSVSTSTRFDRTRFVRLSIPGSCMAIVVTELVVDIFARILFVSAKGTCNIPVSFVENRYKLDVNR